MTDPRDYKLDISSASVSDPAQAPPSPSAQASGAAGSPLISPASAKTVRPFLSVQFACCGVYQRVYLSSDGTHYPARCPKCAKLTNFRVGPGGTDAREFIVT